MMKDRLVQFPEVNRFDRFLFALVRPARRLVDWADENLHAVEVTLRNDFSQRREQSEPQHQLLTVRSFAVAPEGVQQDAAVACGAPRRRKCSAEGCQNRAQMGSSWCADCRKGVVRPRRRRSHTTAADFDRRFTNN